MATLTTKFALRKPGGADFVSPSLDIGDNMDKIDAALGEKRRYRKTDGAMTLVNNMTNPITGAGTTTADLVFKAVVGDWVEVGINGLWGSEAFFAYLDVWSRVAGTPINSWGGNLWSAPTAGHQGLVGWRGEPSLGHALSGTAVKQIVAGDIDGTGNVTVTPYGSGSGGARTIFAGATVPFMWHAINHGQP